ncbi:MAG: class I SAM-dependent RNA methyltransferase [Syntrophobacterales bacterium]|jgi:tRNA/tmRNA/rRNA uracil-C5-methylase (TrmA/RlmC/RlmD family)|nr:class I SAM-dependent RNA methyltransferase [Syntrophobacterales bacterium]
MKLGGITEMEITGVAFGGEGIGRVDNKVVFVPHTVDGDVIRCEITDTRPRYARGIIRTILKPSPHRAIPSCDVYGSCGGCCYQHIVYEYQLVLKEKQVRETLQRVGKFSHPCVLPIIKSPQSCHYRLKADFHVMRKDGSFLTGFMSRGSNEITAIKRCEIVDEKINRRYQRWQEELCRKQKAPPLNRVVFWAEEGGEASEYDDDMFVSQVVCQKSLMTPRNGFFQGNQFLLPEMVAMVKKIADLQGDEIVVDGFCGSGLFALFLSPHSRTVYGIEGDKQAMRAARENMRRHRCDNVVLRQEDMTAGLGKMVNDDVHPDVLVIDPPRTGCKSSLIDQVVRLAPERIVYISCNPATQARDIRLLCDRMFQLEFLQPMDMFPHTAHIEVIALLTRKTP